MKIDIDKLSPMMRKYVETKNEYPDCILFYRLGDFYEMFFDDALIASKVLDLALTGKSCGLEERAPMCGVPHHSANQYITKMIQAGYKVAIGEQIEDPKSAKGLVKRAVVQIVTPGTILEDDALENKKNNYLCGVYIDGHSCGITYTDISTGELNVTRISRDNIKEEIAKIYPKEIITNDPEFKDEISSISMMSNIYVNVAGESKGISMDSLLSDKRIYALLDKSHFTEDITMDLCIFSSLKMVLNYILETQMVSANNFVGINQYNSSDYMFLDHFTRVNLELTKTIRDSGRKGTLLDVLDSTQTPMGARLLRKYIEQPLINHRMIEKRLDLTESIKENYVLMDDLKDGLSRIYDLERISSKVAYDRVTPKDLINLKTSISKLPGIKNVVDSLGNQKLKEFISSLDLLEDVYSLIDESIDESATQTVKSGNVIKEGYSEELDSLRDISTNGAKIISDIEAREKEKTGSKTLKVGYNKVFGYYIEITKAQLATAKLSDEYMRKQTLVNAERFITPELKDIEEKIVHAKERIEVLELELFRDIRNKISNEISRILSSASLVAELDVYLSNAIVATRLNYVRPKFNKRGRLCIKEGRHPVIEKIIGEDSFISNDSLIEDENSIHIITGPNMSGKSTYMRQVALISLMAHIGTFVPAEEADIPLLDRIFTRVGASDDLAQGQSTFMVEMNEVSQILKNATKNSLIILDEVGRGTSTYDGISLAWSIVEYIHDNLGSKTLFATHYHELSELESKFENVKNYSIDVSENGENVIFLRKIIPKAADRSYGIYVAKLAKLPDKVIKRADEILEKLESNHIQENIGEYVPMSDDSSYTLHDSKDYTKIDSPSVEMDESSKELLDSGESFEEEKKSASEECKSVLSDSISDSNLEINGELKNDSYAEEIIEDIRNIDFMNSTPMEIMNFVFELKNKVNKLDK